MVYVSLPFSSVSPKGLIRSVKEGMWFSLQSSSASSLAVTATTGATVFSKISRSYNCVPKFYGSLFVLLIYKKKKKEVKRRKIEKVPFWVTQFT